MSSPVNCLDSLSSSSGGLFPSRMIGTDVFALDPLQNKDRLISKARKTITFRLIRADDDLIQKVTFLLEPLQGDSLAF